MRFQFCHIPTVLCAKQHGVYCTVLCSSEQPFNVPNKAAHSSYVPILCHSFTLCQIAYRVCNFPMPHPCNVITCAKYSMGQVHTLHILKYFYHMLRN
jgi:hypothetical protein